MVTRIVPNLGHGKSQKPKVFYLPPVVLQEINYSISIPSGTTYTYTGTAVTLKVGIQPSGGTYTYTGTAATLNVGISPSGGTYTFTGTSPALNVGMTAGSGTYSYTGTDIHVGYGVSTPEGIYTYSGSSVTLAYSPGSVSLGSGTYTFTGTDVTLDQESFVVGGRYITEEEVEEEPFLGSIKPVYAERYSFPDSSNIEAAYYDKDSKELQIRFKKGSTYKYDNVTPSKIKGLVKAKSSGTYFHSKIKPKYPGKKM